MAVSVDVVSSSSGSGHLWSYTHTCSGTNLLLLVAVHITGPNIHVGTITYDGVALTDITNNGGYEPYTDWYGLFALIAPTTGANTLAISTGDVSSTSEVWAVSLTGVDQTTAYGTPASANGNSAAISVTVASTVGALIVDFPWVSSLSGETITAGILQTSQQNAQLTEALIGNSTEAGAASVAMFWTISGALEWWSYGISVNPSAGGTAYHQTVSALSASFATSGAKSSTKAINALLLPDLGSLGKSPARSVSARSSAPQVALTRSIVISTGAILPVLAGSNLKLRAMAVVALMKSMAVAATQNCSKGINATGSVFSSTSSRQVIRSTISAQLSKFGAITSRSIGCSITAATSAFNAAVTYINGAAHVFSVAASLVFFNGGANRAIRKQENGILNPGKAVVVRGVAHSIAAMNKFAAGSMQRMISRSENAKTITFGALFSAIVGVRYVVAFAANMATMAVSVVATKGTTGLALLGQIIDGLFGRTSIQDQTTGSGTTSSQLFDSATDQDQTTGSGVTSDQRACRGKIYDI